jgi:hypothetical protein
MLSLPQRRSIRSPLPQVIARIARILARAGTLVEVEWAWEDFRRGDSPLVLPTPRADEEVGGLHRRWNEWAASGQPWTKTA